MAIGATIFTFEVQLSDVDRGVYEAFSIRVAKHPSETEAYMVTRLLAYCCEYAEGISFGVGGVSSTDEPAVLLRDATGAIRVWVEVGAPSAARLHSGSKAATKAVVYTHRDPATVLGPLEGKNIHRASAIDVVSFEPEKVNELIDQLKRRNALSVSRTEGTLYLELNGHATSVETQTFRLS